jgi:microcystin-dependent protein
MAEPFLGEIKIISWNFAPKGWSFCNGQLLPINQNQALFSILGTTYGGDGRVNFALPDFRGKVPIYQGGGWLIGQTSGEEFHTLTQQEMTLHQHQAMAQAAAANSPDPTNSFLADVSTKAYGPSVALLALAASSVSNVGQSQPHENRQPFLVLNFIIALQGIFPSRN